MAEFTSLPEIVKTALPVIITAVISLALVTLVYNILKKQIIKLKEQEYLDSNTAFLLGRGVQWLFYIIVAVIIFDILGIQVDFFVGLWVLAGGTIIGFASMNTIGNAIAGLLIMLSRPFKIDDQLYFQGKYVIVEDIDLIYTRMRTLDNVIISVPNQTLLEKVIENHSIRNTIRRRVVLTVDYSESPDRISRLLLDAVNKVEEILSEPEPYVWITEFRNYAMEYTLFYHIASNDKILEIDSSVKKQVVEVFNENNIDLSTPNLIHSV